MKSQPAKQHRVRSLGALALVFASSFAIQHSSISADAPTLIPFQARLTNQQGVAYPNGTYTITFNIYSDAVGGSTNWTERHEKVGVVNGMVNVFLGSIQPFANVQANPNDDVDFSTTRYLGITVDADDNPATADPEMVPRQMIIPAFFSKNSQKLAGHDWSTLLVSGNNPQTGFLNGSKIGSGTVTNVQIQDGSVGTAELGNAQITGEKLAPGAVDAAMSDGAITTAKIMNGAVTLSKLAPRPLGSSVGGLASVDVNQSFAGNYPNWTPIPTATIDITVTGRPVMVGLFAGWFIATNTTSHQDYCGLRLMRENLSNGQKIQIRDTGAYNVIEASSGHQHPSRIEHPSTFIMVDAPAAGTYRYTLERTSFTNYSIKGQFAAFEF